MVKGFKKNGKFRPTEKDKTITGITKKTIGSKPPTPKISTTTPPKEKFIPEVSKAKIQSLKDDELNSAIGHFNSMFDKQTKFLEKNNGQFDETFTRETHERTLDTLNMLIEEATRRKTAKQLKKK